jgi:hypothetical protein
MQNSAKRPGLLLWLVTTFLITFSLPSPSVHSDAFGHAAAAYARDASVKTFERLSTERRKIADRRVWLLLARWMATFSLGLAAFVARKRVIQRHSLRSPKAQSL